MRTLVWFRGKDLRTADHQPLRDAAGAGEVIPFFVLDPYFFAPDRARGMPHRMQFLVESLHALAGALAELGSRLVLVAGKSVDVVPRLARVWKVDRVVAHRWVEPFGRERDRRIGQALHVPFDLYEGETLLPPGTLRTRAGTPFSIFTPFRRQFMQVARIAAPLPAPDRLPPVPPEAAALSQPLPGLAELGLSHNARLLPGGESAARERLRCFLSGPAGHYHQLRDRLDQDGTSRLSQDLKFGTLSVRAVWTAVEQTLGDGPAALSFHNELIWREFTHSMLWDWPELLNEPFRRDFTGFPWQRNETLWAAWSRGRTGYPLVDAAARQLLAEGFVHNRARMIAASFLSKHLLIDYRRGEAHYMHYLTDGDWAQNNAGWQWSAGCGCDAQPYFRVFNPVAQGQRFDPDGTYVRRWVPELAAVPARFVHCPWQAPPEVLRAAGVWPGDSYPQPIVEHRLARERFLALASQHLRRSAGASAAAVGR
jgi:deoxyribodipyrimidine photo-lyase